MDAGTENPSSGFTAEINLEKVHKLASELVLLGKLMVGLLGTALECVTDVLGRALGSRLVRGHFHLVLSALVLFGPALSLWVSRYSIFANSNHYLYRKFLRSAWGWTCLFSSSFILLLSLSARHPPSVLLRHLSRMGLVAFLLWGCRRLLSLLEDASGTCYEPLAVASPSLNVQGTPPPPQTLLLLHEDQTKASCLWANMEWRGYEVSQDVLTLCLCCLLLVEEASVLGPHLARSKAPAKAESSGESRAPLRIVFFLCVVLLYLWMFLLLCLLAHFPKFPSQQLGGALGYLAWRGLYQGLYRLKVGWGCPCLPEEGLLTATDIRKQPQ